MKASTLLLFAGGVLVGFAAAAPLRAEEASGGKMMLFAATKALGPVELAQTTGLAAVAIPLPDAGNVNLSEQGDGGGTNAFASELVQNITNQVATAVGTAVATDISINAGNVVVGGGESPTNGAAPNIPSIPDFPGGQNAGGGQSFNDGGMPSMSSPWSSLVK